MFLKEVMRDKPLALYMMDDTSPFQDYSGYNRNGVAGGGTAPKHVSLIAGTSFSQVFDNTIVAQFDSPVFRQDYESDNFSLEAWVRTIGPAAEQRILGHTNHMDGLLVNGSKASFVVKFVTAPEARISFDLQEQQTMHLVATKSQSKINLYVNGLLVAETSLTPEQQNDRYITTGSTLNAGACAGTQKIALAGVGLYSYVLSDSSIQRHYFSGTAVPGGQGGAESLGAASVSVSSEYMNVFVSQTWDSTEDWETGLMQNTASADGNLVPQISVDTSLPGTWLNTIPLDATGLTSVYGVSLDWNGLGASVEVSLDGETWETAERHKNLGLVPNGFDPTEQLLQVRVTFAGGIINDPSYLDYLTVNGFAANSMLSSAGRTVTFTNVSPKEEHLPLALHQNWGSDIPAGGSVVISADASEVPQVARTIELWIKRNGANPTLSVTGTTYQNGALTNATLVDNQWTLMHVVAPADVTGDITITGPAQIGQVAIYPTAISAASVLNAYNRYTANRALKIADTGVTVTEAPLSDYIYAHDWSVESAV